MADASSSTSNKRRHDNFLQGLGTPSSPSGHVAVNGKTATDDLRPTTPTATDVESADDSESISAKRQRLGLSGSAYVNRIGGMPSAGEALKNWSAAAAASLGPGGSSSIHPSSPHSSTYSRPATPAARASAFGSPAFSASRSSILHVNPNSASTTTPSRRLQSRSAAAAPPALYNPGDRAALLARLATFQELTDWTPKPERASEIEWARRGWTCRGRERVACALCRRELVVGLNRKQVDGREVSVLVASEIEEALVDKYVELMVTEHLEDCPWRKLGCDDSLLRVPLNNAKDALAELRVRYHELVEREDFLPYEFNLRLPSDLDLGAVIAQLPPDLARPDSATASTDKSSPSDKPATDKTPSKKDKSAPAAAANSSHRVALALALFGWQRLSNPRMGLVRDTVSCHTCLRRLGLWMFKSKEVAADGHTIVTPAPMDHLDVVAEHRFFCPWKNPAIQRTAAAPNPANHIPAWRRLVRVIHSDATMRGVLEPRARSFLGRTFTLGGGGGGGGLASALSTPVRNSGLATRSATPGSVAASVDGASVDGDGDGEEDDETARQAKEKAMYSRLRRIKSLFVPKSKRPSKTAGTASQASSRPGTSQSMAPEGGRGAGAGGQAAFVS